MIHLVSSNRTEALVVELAGRVRAQQRRAGVLAPVSVVVPGAGIEEFVRMGVARVAGIAANLDTMRMTRFAARELATAGASRIATAEDFEAMALTLLLDPAFLEQGELDAVRAYVAAGTSREATDVRRVELAARVGRLFEEYTYSRSDLLAAWSAGHALRDGSLSGLEVWQRRLWLGMFGDGGLGRTRRLVPLHEAVGALPAQVAGAANPPGSREAALDVHVFGFAHFAPVFHALFARLSASRDVVLYSLSPCEGFWEDFDPRDPAPLKLWGRPGREHVRALDAAAGFDHEDRFVEPAGSSLLAQLQRDLLHREPARESVDPRFAFEDDESIVVLEHASVRRELEAVASEIWRLLARDPTLRFDDIAVLVPDAESAAYLAHLPAVFREAHQVPYQMHGLPLLGERRVLEAVELLLALPLGRFTRQELLGLAMHPAVVASLEGVDVSSWLSWCDRLGIVHGADREDHEDTYIERDIWNWDQGLRRLALGVFLAGDGSGDRRPFDLGEDAYVPHEVSSAEARDAAGFGLLVRSLLADARALQASDRSLPEWSAVLADMVRTYIAPRSDGDVEALVECQRRLHALGHFDVGDRRLSYRLVCELARARIASVPTRRGSEGVFVSRIGAARAIPFRAVFACGMGEGRFPSPDAEDALDLRWESRRPGDVTAREGDKYAFLETLLGARDRLYLSYVSRDPLSGDAIAPSSVVAELLHALGRGYMSDPGALRRRHPLRRWDPVYFPELFPASAAADPPAAPMPPSLGTMCLPEARAEAQTLALRRALERTEPRMARERTEALVSTDPAWSAVAEHMRIARAPAAGTAVDGRVAVSTYALLRFLEFPLQGWARFRVGLDELEDDDVLAREDEPFETRLRDETLLLRAVLLEAAKGRRVDEVYDEVRRERELRGNGPSGVFAEAERSEHLQTLDSWQERLQALAIALPTMTIHRFGRGGEHATADRVHPPLALEVDVVDADGMTRIVRAEIGGRMLPVGNGDTSVTLSRRARENKDDWAAADRRRAALRAFVDHAVLAASGVSEGRAHASVVIVATPDGTTAERVQFAPLARGEATVWLRGLVRELLGGPHAYFLPCEALFVHRARGGEGTLVATLEKARDLLGDGDGPPRLRSVYGPVPRPHRYPVPSEASAQDMVRVRFGLLFDAWQGDP